MVVRSRGERDSLRSQVSGQIASCNTEACASGRSKSRGQGVVSFEEKEAVRLDGLMTDLAGNGDGMQVRSQTGVGLDGEEIFCPRAGFIGTGCRLAVFSRSGVWQLLC
jgi:hypothetical protein